jgi:hypothetical protein
VLFELAKDEIAAVDAEVAAGRWRRLVFVEHLRRVFVGVQQPLRVARGVNRRAVGGKVVFVDVAEHELAGFDFGGVVGALELTLFAPAALDDRLRDAVVETEMLVAVVRTPRRKLQDLFHAAEARQFIVPQFELSRERVLLRAEDHQEDVDGIFLAAPLPVRGGIPVGVAEDVGAFGRGHAFGEGDWESGERVGVESERVQPFVGQREVEREAFLLAGRVRDLCGDGGQPAARTHGVADAEHEVSGAGQVAVAAQHDALNICPV